MLDHLDAPSEMFFNEGYAAASSGPDLERAELEQQLLQIQELYRSGLLMSQCLHRLHPPRVAGESLEEGGVFPVGLKRLGECLLE